MATKEYYGSAQFQPIAQQREHDDRFIKELLFQASELDIGISDFMIEDIIDGNTATLRKFGKANRMPEFKMNVYDGSTHQKINVTKLIDQDWYPVIPIKDDDSGAGGYAGFTKQNPKRRKVEKALGYLDMDLETLSDAVLEPEEIPKLGTSEWRKAYGRTWKSSPTLQADHGTEAAWRDSMVEGRIEQLDAIKDITDIHVGLYATAGTLDEANTVAVYYEMAKLLPQLSFRGYSDADVPDFPPQTYMFHAVSGHWQAVSGMRGWTHVIRKGTVKNKYDISSDIDMYKNKSNVNFYYSENYVRRISDGDPVHKVIRADPAWEAKLGTSQSVAGNTGVPGDVKALIEIQVQLTRGANPTYGEIRMWNYETTHIVTNDADDKITTIRGNLGGKIIGTVGGPSVGAPTQTVTINEGETIVGTYGTSNIDIAWSVEDPMFNIGIMNGTLSFNSPAAAGIYTVKIVAVGNGPEDTGAQSPIVLTIKVLDASGSEPTIVPWQPGWDKETCNANGYFYCPIVDACLQTTLAEAAAISATHEPGSEDYDDLCYFPIGVKSTKEVPFFKRERLIRESVQLGIYSVKIVKLKWYQERWFSIAIFVVGLIFSVVSGGGSVYLALQNMLITTAIGLAIQVVVKILSQFINNPFLVAIAMVVVGVITGYINLDAMMNTVKMVMDVTGVAIKEFMQNRMQELEKQMKEFSQQANDLQEEMDTMMEEVGLMRIDAWDYLKRMLVVPNAEMPTHALDRTTDVGVSLEINTNSMVDVHNLWDSMITQN